MSGGAIAFMAISWTFVLSLAGWAFMRLLTDKKHHDPDGIGPASPPVPPHAKKKK
jgi:hypothetical protein